jgi:NodT family efflux transporter outer membrane factor (OMF) lipoprotein
LAIFTFRYAVLIALAACSLAPDYKAPDIAQPPDYKESGDWVEAQPDDAVARGAWWTVFQDPQLNALEDQVTQANQNLKIAVAQYDQAKALAAIARAAYFPAITANAGASRQQASRTLANNPPNNLYNQFSVGADLSYEIDVWGRVRNTVAANEDQAQASAADLANVALSLHAELASDYFALRGDDAAQDVLDKTVAADQEAYDLTKRRYEGGVVAELDVDQAETQLENAKTQSTDMRLQRAQLEHAIAILTGQAPADFNLAPATLVAKLPRLNAGLPSVLLQRRPDIAAAERRTAAANAEIGVARAAYFPTFDLSAMLGFESASAAKWLTAPSQFWGLGPSMFAPIFEGGQIDALNDQARAAYNQAVAAYRQTVLNAYGEVEDNLVALHRLEQEAKTQKTATAAAERALAQANDRYKSGITTYLDVVTTQNNELQAQLDSVNIVIRRLTASVRLIEAIGGGWQPVPADDQTFSSNH